MKKKIHVMNTAFRDGFQSVFGARVFTKDFLPAVEACREAGMTILKRVAEPATRASTFTVTRTPST